MLNIFPGIDTSFASLAAGWISRTDTSDGNRIIFSGGCRNTHRIVSQRPFSRRTRMFDHPLCRYPWKLRESPCSIKIAGNFD